MDIICARFQKFRGVFSEVEPIKLTVFTFLGYVGTNNVGRDIIALEFEVVITE